MNDLDCPEPPSTCPTAPFLVDGLQESEIPDMLKLYDQLNIVNDCLDMCEFNVLYDCFICPPGPACNNLPSAEDLMEQFDINEDCCLDLDEFTNLIFDIM